MKTGCFLFGWALRRNPFSWEPVRSPARGEGAAVMTPENPSRPNGLGEPIAVFKPMMGNIIAGLLLSVLLLVGGAAALGFPLRAAYLADWDLPVDVEKGWSWLAVGL